MSGPGLTALDYMRYAVEALKAERLVAVQRYDENWSAENDERLTDMTKWLKSMESVESHMEGWAAYDQRAGNPA